MFPLLLLFFFFIFLFTSSVLRFFDLLNSFPSLLTHFRYFISFFLILSFLFSLFFRFPSPLFPFQFPPQLIIPFFLLSSLPPFPFPHHFLLFSLLSSFPLSLSPIPFSFALKVRLQSLLISSNDLSHTQQLLRTEFQESQNVANERRNQVRHLP